MTRRELPKSAWVEVAIDFMGPLPSGEYLLVIVDYYSRYKELEVMTKITARETITRLDKIFTRLGYPKLITLDNGRQFISQEFEEYCKNRNIGINLSTPYWPQENGEVERQNRSLLKRLKISHSLNRDWKKDLSDYLMMYYTTPHSTTGKTPTEMLFGRTIRSKIPSITEIQYNLDDGEVRDRDALNKQKGKEREDIRRKARHSEINVGDKLLMQNLLPKNKLSSTFQPATYEVIERQGNSLQLRNEDTMKTYQRNVAHTKPVPMITTPSTDNANLTIPFSDLTQPDSDSGVHEDSQNTHTELHSSTEHDSTEDNRRSNRNRSIPKHLQEFELDSNSRKKRRCGTGRDNTSANTNDQ